MDNEFVADSDEDQQLDLATWPPSVKHKDDASLLAKQSDTNFLFSSPEASRVPLPTSNSSAKSKLKNKYIETINLSDSEDSIELPVKTKSRKTNMKATESPKLAKSKRGESQGLDDEETRTTASHADKVKPLRDPTSKTNDTETSKRKKRKKIDDEDEAYSIVEDDQARPPKKKKQKRADEPSSTHSKSPKNRADASSSSIVVEQYSENGDDDHPKPPPRNIKAPMHPAVAVVAPDAEDSAPDELLLRYSQIKDLKTTAHGVGEPNAKPAAMSSVQPEERASTPTPQPTKQKQKAKSKAKGESKSAKRQGESQKTAPTKAASSVTPPPASEPTAVNIPPAKILSSLAGQTEPPKIEVTEKTSLPSNPNPKPKPKQDSSSMSSNTTHHIPKRGSVSDLLRKTGFHSRLSSSRLTQRSASRIVPLHLERKTPPPAPPPIRKPKKKKDEEEEDDFTGLSEKQIAKLKEEKRKRAWYSP